MNSKVSRTKFIGINFIFYLGAFGIAINLFINDKLRAEMEEIINKGLKNEEMRKIHDRLAPTYEKKTDNFEIRSQYNKYRRILVSYAKGKVLECGIGSGRNLEYYKEDADVICIDHSPKMLEQAEKKLNELKYKNINKNAKFILTQMDCQELRENFPENLFDAVVDVNNFQSYNDYKLVLNGIKNVLKDKGLFLLLARGESDIFFIKDIYKLFRPYVFMKFGQDLTTNWSNVIENDKDWEILFKERKNYGRTYIYILKLHKNGRDEIINDKYNQI